MLQASQEFNFSIYIYSEEEEARKELAARPVDKEALIKAMSELKLEGEWRITQTSCGIIISFMKETDLLAFHEVDITGILGIAASAISFSALDTYRQKLLIRDVPWPITEREIEAALTRQGVIPLSIIRTRHANIVLEVADPCQFSTLLQDGFDFFGSGKFATIPLPNMSPIPTHLPARDLMYQSQKDSILQCYKCQGFWHYAAQCPGMQRCVRCGDSHPVSECPRPRNDPVCVHCSGRHHAAYKLCPVRLQMQTYLPHPLPPLYMPAYLPPSY